MRGGRVGRRAVAKLDRFYFVSIQARSAVPQSRSAAAPGAVRRPPQKQQQQQQDTRPPLRPLRAAGPPTAASEEAKVQRVKKQKWEWGGARASGPG